jgi:hypothetical protein
MGAATIIPLNLITTVLAFMLLLQGRSIWGACLLFIGLGAPGPWGVVWPASSRERRRVELGIAGVTLAACFCAVALVFGP